jgi:hypothetical protein
MVRVVEPRGLLTGPLEAKPLAVEKPSGVEVLRELMAPNGLRQKDLADDLGGESIVPLTLREKRQLNRKQMEKLSPLSRFPCGIFLKLGAESTMETRHEATDARSIARMGEKLSKIGHRLDE